MTRKGRGRLRLLSRRVQLAHPQLDAADAIERGLVRVDGRIVTNPRSLVPDGASVTLVSREVPLRGEAKLEAALAAFGVDVRGRVALDLGASAGGFTRALLRAGAARVYAVDAGYGQLLGSLRQDQRVVDLERTNLGALSAALVPDEVGVVTADLSYVPLAVALPQLAGRVHTSSAWPPLRPTRRCSAVPSNAQPRARGAPVGTSGA
jgi:23S rRNA (cytidine1920-2'-O)/16S rRNA (cytidine1409-2'-O)-methyltransferase